MLERYLVRLQSGIESGINILHACNAESFSDAIANAQKKYPDNKVVVITKIGAIEGVSEDEKVSD